MLWRLLILSTAVGALRTPGRPAGSLPKPHQRSRNFDTAELFVANLPDDSERDEFLRFARSAFPAVRRVTLPRDRSTGAARGFVRDPCPLFVSTESWSSFAQAFVEVPRDDVPAAVAALDGALLGSKRLKARPADKRTAAAPDRSDRSSYAVNQRLAA
jgi:RNA recognition motif-containing protein